MADEGNIFDEFDPELAPPTAAAPATAPAPPTNVFDEFDPDKQPQTSGLEAAFRSFNLGIIPAAASLVEAGAGAAVGAELGAMTGLPFAKPAGAIAGGLIGGIHGAYTAATAQDFGLSMLPEDWQDFLKISNEQRTLDAQQHPTETFLGGQLPFLLTMKPGGFGYKPPKNATTFERIAASPITGRIFGGAVNGGFELGTELAQGEAPDPMKIGIATGFGMVFNAPNRIGARLLSTGERIAQPATLAGRMTAERVRERFNPTISQAGDAKVVGPGITEEVFMGTQTQSPQAEMAAQDAARTEASILTPERFRPPVRTVARDMEPELFAEYDNLAAQRDDLTARIQSIIETPAPEPVATPDGQPVPTVAPIVDNAEVVALRAQVAAVDAQMRDMAPMVGAAMRRAADFSGGEVVEPEIIPAPETETVEAQASRAALDEQIAAITNDMTQQLLAAGRPESEARAAGALIGRRYATRAARIGRSDPLALYQAEGALVRGVGPQAAPVAAAKPPLMPTVDQPSIGRVAESAALVAPEAPSVAEPAAPNEAKPAQIAPSEIESLDPNTIEVDAKRFQFKAGGDEAGVTERLQDVQQWDARLAGTALVYRDAEGRNFIADGHQRLGLAKRLSATQPGIKINAFVLNAADGISDVDARAIAAIKNIAEGTGSAVDAAKVLRAAKETGIDLPPLPPRSALVREGRALANLSPEAFGIIVNEVVPTNQGAIVGRMVQVPEQQVEALRLLATLKPDNVQQAEMIVRDMLSTGTTEGRMESLFGAEDYAGSIVLERAKIADEAMKLLRKDKATFKTLVEEADRIQTTGANVLDQATNQSRLSTDEQAADFLKQLAFRAGPVSDALSEVARKLKSGDLKTGEAARTFLGDVRRAVEAGVVTGDDAGGPVDGAVGERPQLAEFGYKQDNPAVDGGEDGREWLADKQADADKTYERNKGIVGAATARFLKPLSLPTDVLAKLPGLRGEQRGPGEPQFDALMKKVGEEGWKQDASPILLAINHRGEPFIVEGNTRVAVAAALGEPTVRAEVKWMNGGEQVEGEWAPEKVTALAEPPIDEGPELFQGATPKIGSFNTLPDGRAIGYRVVNIGPDGQFVSQADSRTSVGATGKDAVPKFVSNDPQYVVDYYSNGEWGGENGRQALVAYAFDPNDVLSGKMDDAQPELSIGKSEVLWSKELTDDGVAGAVDEARSVGVGSELFQPAPPIDTPEFNRWFGDSKVVDESGAPLVVYHGTDATGIDAFDPAKIGKGADSGFYGRGYYFGSEELAADYGSTAVPVYLSIKKPFVWDLTTPELQDDTIRRVTEISAEAGAVLKAGASNFNERVPVANRFTAALRAAGYDGVFIEAKGVDGMTLPHEIMAFDPTQIKSVNNRGTFDPSDPRILYQSKPDGNDFFQRAKPQLWREGDMLGEFNTERGLEGLPQAVIPGAEVTDADRLKLAMSKPLKGGNAPPPKGGLFDVEGRQDAADQLTLFQPAYHGTPHIFDKFDSSKIGTGEGAQAYGYGIYLSSSKEVAAWYRKSLAGGEVLRFDGTPLRDLVGGTGTPVNVAMQNAPAILEKLDLGPMPDEVMALYPDAQKYADVPTYRALALREVLHGIVNDVSYLNKSIPAAIDNEIKHWRGVLDENLQNKMGQEAAKSASRLQLAEAIKASGLISAEQQGRLITADVPDTHELMDWDKPLSEQPEAVKKAFDSLGFGMDVPDAVWINGTTPRDFIDGLDVPWGVNEAFREAIEAHPRDKDAALADFRKRASASAAKLDEDGEFALLNAAKKVEDAVADASVIFDQPPKPNPDELVEDEWLRGIIKDALKMEPDARNVHAAIDNDADLSQRAREWARANDSEHDLRVFSPADIVEMNAKEFFDRAAIINNYMSDSGSAWKKASDAYAELSDKLGGDAAASNALREAGIPGHQYVGHESQKTNYVIYDDSRINVTEYEQKKRGSITLAEGQRPLIKLFADADSSTFIHETGHQWLEELMRDAREGAATDALKTDADTVRKWLGIGEDGKIATKSHEKFARSFEQYMREGVAPSASLARVFAQFKNWLTQIYQTIRGLGTPINDDIRAVFDRLIEMEPQRTVISEEAEANAGGIARTHETDAETVEPAEADLALDRMNAERLRSIEELPPEVQNELATAEAELAAADAAASLAGGEDGAGAGGPDEVVALGGEPEPLPGSGTGSSEPGAKLGGGGAGRAESLSAPSGATSGAGGDSGLRAERPSAADAARTNPLAPSATTLFGPEESPFTDKAGNIRLDTLTNDEDVRQAIRASAEENQEFIGDRRGVITDGQVMDLADALGMDAESLNQRKVGQAFNAEQIMAARKLLIESATNLSATAKRVAASNSTDEDVLAYAQARAKHRMIQGHVAGITAEAGRALRAFRNIAGEMDQAKSLDQLMRESSARTLFQIREEAKLAAMLDTPQKLSKFMNDAEKPGFIRMVQEYWINALVSGPRTHVTNMVSNALFTIQRMGPETATAAAIGAIRAAAGRPGERVRAGEVIEQFRRAGAAFPIATRAAIDSLKAGKGIELPEDGQIALPYQIDSDLAPAPKLDETTTYADLIPDLFGLLRGISDAAVAVGKLVSTGGDASAPLVGLKRSPLGAIPDVQVRGTTVLPVGTVARIPTRFLAASDSFFRAMTYSSSKGAQAYRRAVEEGLTGTARDARIAQLYQNPDAAMIGEAADFATESAFMARESQFVKAFSHLANTPIMGVPIVKFVTPFINTPANIIEQTALHRTPLGLLSPEIRADLAGRNGNVAQDTAMAKMLVGSAYAIGFGFMAAQGFLNGSGPKDQNEKNLWRLAGNQANSIRIGDTWYDVRALGPLGMLASISADLYGVAGAADEDGISGAASQLLNAFIQNILNASFMTGPADLIQAVEDPDRYGSQYVEKFLSSFIPAAMAQPARAMDPYTREARNLVDSLRNRVPVVSQQLLPRVSIWGEPMPSGTAFGLSGLSPIYTTQMTKDPVNIVLTELGYFPAYPQRRIRGVELTDQQYNEYATLAGRMTKGRLDLLVTAPAFGNWPSQVKHDVISEVVRQSREVARNIMMSKYPQIAADAVKLKLAPFGEQEE